MPGRRAPGRRAIGLGQATQPTRGSIAVSTAAISTSVPVGDAAYDLQPFLVTNPGPGPWNNPQFGVSYGSGSAWLSLSSLTNADGSISVTPTITPGANTAGTKTATVTITDSKVVNSGVTVTISLVLTAVAPTINLTPSTLNITVQDETTGTAVPIAISNSGGSSLATPTVGTLTGTGAAYLGTPAITGSGPWTLTITPDATGGTAGVYQATVPILSTGASNTPYNLDVIVTVTAGPQAILGISKPISDGDSTVGGTSPSTDALSLFSQNATPLTGPVIDSTTYSGTSSGWATVTVTSTQLTVAYDVSGIGVDGTSYLDTVISDPAASNTITHRTVLKMGTVAATNVLNVTPTGVSQSVIVGGSVATQTVTIVNAGSGGMAGLGTITATLGSTVAWVTSSYTAGASSSTVTLTFTTSGLATGTYSNTLTVTASGAANSPIVVPVQVVVTAAPVAGVHLLKYTLPSGVTQNATTGYCEGVPTGISTTRPSNYNAAATHIVTTAAEFTAALNTSRTQDNPVIEIPAGTTITGYDFLLQPRTGAGYCVIRGGGFASLPAQGTRVLPSRDAQYMGVIDTPNANPSLRYMPGANRYYVHGIKFTDTAPAPASGGTANYAQVVTIPTVYQGSPTFGYVSSYTADESNAPSDLYWDQIIGEGSLGTRRWGQLYGFRLSITDSYIAGYECQGNKGPEAQAVSILYGGSKYYIANTYMSAAGEHFMLGGAPIPYEDDRWNSSDVYIKQCHFRGLWKWFSWSGTSVYDGYNVGFKNSFELKRGRRVLIDGCIFERGGAWGQAGMQIVFKSDQNNGGRGPIPTVSGTFDVQMIHCIGRDLQRAVAIGGNGSPNEGKTIPNDRHHIMDNLFYSMNIPPNSSSGYMFEIGNGASNCDFDHNTWCNNGGTISNGLLSFLGGTTYNLNFTDNIIAKGTYGISSSAGQFYKAALDAKCSGYTWTRNVHPGTWTTNEKNVLMPAGNYYPTSDAAVGYTQLLATTPADLTLAASSLYDTVDASGGPVGADIARIVARTAGVESP